MYNRFSELPEEDGTQQETTADSLPLLQEKSGGHLLLSLIAALLLKENYSHNEILTILSILDS